MFQTFTSLCNLYPSFISGLLIRCEKHNQFKMLAKGLPDERVSALGAYPYHPGASHLSEREQRDLNKFTKFLAFKVSNVTLERIKWCVTFASNMLLLFVCLFCFSPIIPVYLLCSDKKVIIDQVHSVQKPAQWSVTFSFYSEKKSDHWSGPVVFILNNWSTMALLTAIEVIMSRIVHWTHLKCHL